MTAEDQSDYERFKKLLDRLGKAVIMSAETETAEIIRRRLFDWPGCRTRPERRPRPTPTGWSSTASRCPPVSRRPRRRAVPGVLPVPPARAVGLRAEVASLPRFQKTRGVFGLLALWVSHAYQEGYKGAHRDPLIGLGTAPLDDPSSARPCSSSSASTAWRGRDHRHRGKNSSI